jgi:hypothetical protein
MVKKQLIEKGYLDAVELIRLFLDGDVSQEEFTERATRLVNDPVAEEVRRAKEARATE